MSSYSVRQVEGSPQVYGQGITERVVYVFHFDKMLEPIGTPTQPIAAYLYDVATGVDMAATNLEGAPALSGLEFSSPVVKDLVRDTRYRLVAEVTVGGQKFSAYKDLVGEL